MPETFSRCDACWDAVVTWPRTMTLYGHRNLCTACHFRYVRLFDELAAYHQHHVRLSRPLGVEWVYHGQND